MKYTLENWRDGVTPPDGWDAADAARDGWLKDDLDALMRESVGAPWEGRQRPEDTAAPEIPHEPTPAAAPRGAQPEMRSTVQAQPATVVDLKTRVQYDPDEAWQRLLVLKEDGYPKPRLLNNFIVYLRHHPSMHGVLAWNSFSLKLMLIERPPWITDAAPWEGREIKDSDYAHMVTWLERKNMTPTVSGVVTAASAVAEENSFDPLMDYLAALKWDGKPRVKSWVTKYLGGAKSEYNAIIGRRFLISAIARALKPGCKVDTMLILEGPQGAMKSSAWRALFSGDFFADHLSDITSKDSMMEVQGIWGMEVQEMHTFGKAEANAVKKFLSIQQDRYRPPYGRAIVKAPRRAVIVGTMNPDGAGYLNDPTGARRFWPVLCGYISLKELERDRDQLWAEALSEFQDGNPWWVQEEELFLVEPEQAARTEADPWEDILADKFGLTIVPVDITEIFVALGIPRERLTTVHSKRVGRVMKSLGFTRSARGSKTSFSRDA